MDGSLPETNIAPENCVKLLAGRLLSFWCPAYLISGAKLLVSRSVKVKKPLFMVDIP